MILTFFASLLSFNFFSCSKVLPDDVFVLKKADNISKRLKLNGYYYQKWENEKIYGVNVFFSNGNNLFLGDNTTIKELETNLNNDSWLKNIYKHKTWWGLYEINGDDIKFERYYPSSGGGLPAYIRSGKIINDSTFVITQSKRSDGTGMQEKNETYHFRQFSPKPDSTNNFIK